MMPPKDVSAVTSWQCDAACRTRAVSLPQVIFQGADPTVSPNRRRIHEWAVARGYLKSTPKVSELLDRANEALGGS
jgi:hypothetical protein